MGATNLTPNYNLSQFIGTDKPAWLQDYNGDMLKIDSGINAAKVAADNAASAASAAQGDATTALGGVSSLNTTVGTMSTTLGTAVGNINTINSLIGNGTPTTTDQTIIGAINELNTVVSKARGNRVLTAITGISVNADGVKTVGQLLDDLYASFASAMANIPSSDIVVPLIIYGSAIGATYQNIDNATSYAGGSMTASFVFNSLYVDADNAALAINELKFMSSGSSNKGVAAVGGNTSATDYSSNVPSSGDNIGLTFYRYSIC